MFTYTSRAKSLPALPGRWPWQEWKSPNNQRSGPGLRPLCQVYPHRQIVTWLAANGNPVGRRKGSCQKKRCHWHQPWLGVVCTTKEGWWLGGWCTPSDRQSPVLNPGHLATKITDWKNGGETAGQVHLKIIESHIAGFHKFNKWG